MTSLLNIIASGILVIGSFLGLSDYVSLRDYTNEFDRQIEIAKEVRQKLGVVGFNPTGGLTYRLQSSIGTTDTSVTLSSLKNRSDIPLTMAYLGTDIGYGTLSPQTSRSEFISFTGVTQNANGTAQLTGVTRGLSDIFPFTASTTLRNSHPGQSVFILSDSPQLFDEYTKKRSTEVITDVWQFRVPPLGCGTGFTTATSSNQLACRSYVDGVTSQGAAIATSSLQSSTLGLVAVATSTGAAQNLGSTTGAYALHSGISIATPLTENYAKGFVPITDLVTGKLHPNFTATTTDYTWTGNTTFSTTTATNLVTFNGASATTTFNTPVNLVGTTTPNGFRLRDKAGNARGPITVDTFSRQLSGTTTQTTDVFLDSTPTGTGIMNRMIPGGTLGTTTVISGKIFISDYSLNNGTFAIKMSYGKQIVASSTIAVTTGSTQLFGYLEFMLMSAGTTATQEASFNAFLFSRSHGDLASSPLGVYSHWGDIGAGTVDSTLDQQLTFEAQYANNNIDNDLTVSHWYVDIAQTNL